MRGQTSHERNRGQTSFDLGWKQNLVEVLGANWKKVFFWPLVASPTPHDGVNWDTKDTWKLEGPKNRYPIY